MNATYLLAPAGILIVITVLIGVARRSKPSGRPLTEPKQVRTPTPGFTCRVYRLGTYLGLAAFQASTSSKTNTHLSLARDAIEAARYLADVLLRDDGLNIHAEQLELMRQGSSLVVIDDFIDTCRRTIALTSLFLRDVYVTGLLVAMAEGRASAEGDATHEANTRDHILRDMNNVRPAVASLETQGVNVAARDIDDVVKGDVGGAPLADIHAQLAGIRKRYTEALDHV